ncbi:MAG: hypothetical protein DRG83_01175 [Deltaproteobacteria bacterium]|nr:MAG: hypothetical protein DRG83_01175 [Deltaproteobacteria bacterium]
MGKIKKRKIRVLKIIEPTSGGAAKTAFDILENIDTEIFDVSFIYSTIRSEKRYLDLLPLLRERGITLKEVRMEGRINPVSDLKAFLEIFLYVKRNRFDIVHAHSSKAGFLGRIAAKLSSSGIVTIYTPNAMAIYRHYIYKILERIATFATDVIVAVSDSEAKDILKNKIIKSEKIRVIYNGIDINSMIARRDPERVMKELGIPDKAIVIGSVGRLSRQKDPLTFLEAAQIVLKKYPDSRFIWVGDGELRKDVELSIAKMGMEDNVIVTGWRQDVPDLIAAMDIYVTSSIYESFGYSTCEAMAMRKPVVATDVPGTRDAVINGETGFLVPPGDSESLANSIIRLIEDENLRHLMGMRARERVKKYFTIDRMVKSTEELYITLWASKKERLRKIST